MSAQIAAVRSGNQTMDTMIGISIQPQLPGPSPHPHTAHSLQALKIRSGEPAMLSPTQGLAAIMTALAAGSQPPTAPSGTRRM